MQRKKCKDASFKIATVKKEKKLGLKYLIEKQLRTNH